MACCPNVFYELASLPIISGHCNFYSKKDKFLYSYDMLHSTEERKLLFPDILYLQYIGALVVSVTLIVDVNSDVITSKNKNSYLD